MITKGFKNYKILLRIFMVGQLSILVGIYVPQKVKICKSVIYMSKQSNRS